MAGRQRGNTILISAILVLALTVAALTVSRVLLNYGQQQGPEREFLGEQAYALCLSGIEKYAKDFDSLSYSFTVPVASNSVGGNTVASYSVATTTGTVNLVVSPSAPGSFASAQNKQWVVVANTTLTGQYSSIPITRTVQATISCGTVDPCPYVVSAP